MTKILDGFGIPIVCRVCYKQGKVKLPKRYILGKCDKHLFMEVE